MADEPQISGWPILLQPRDAWRPDRSGVPMVVMEAKDLPDEHRTAGNEIRLFILGGEKAILVSPNM